MISYLYKGIDLSQWNGTVDFKALKAAGYHFVILRAGYGKVASQKDKKFEEYYKKATEAGLEVGCYWFSYANTAEDGFKEAQAFLSVIKGKKFSFPCYYDVEDHNTSLKSNISKATLTNMTNNWCKTVEAAGYKAGLYTFYSALNRFNLAEIPYEKWLAKWSTSMGNCSTKDWGLWQHAVIGHTNESTVYGNVPGTNVNGATDCNYAFKDYPSIIGVSFAKGTNKTPKNVTPTKSVKEVAKEVWQGLWGNGDERKKKLTEAGYDYDEVQKAVQAIAPASTNTTKPKKKSVKEIAKEVWQGLWGNDDERKKKLTEAGYDYDEVQKAVSQTVSNASQAPTITAGKKVKFNKVKLYTSATANTSSKTITGNYFIYSTEVLKGRVRITNSANNVGKTPSSKYVTGWVNVSDIK